MKTILGCKKCKLGLACEECGKAMAEIDRKIKEHMEKNYASKNK